MIGHTSGSEPNAQDCPMPIGSIPLQRAAWLHLRSEVHDVGQMHYCTVGNLVQRRHQMATVYIVGQRLIVQVTDALRCKRSGKGQHGNVLIAFMSHRRLRHYETERATALHLLLAPDHRLHGILGLHPRSAARRPSRAVVEGKFHAQTLGFAGSMFEEFEPLVAQVLDGSLWEAHAAIEQRGFVDAYAMHSFQVGRNALARHIAVKPVPPSAHLRLLWRIVKPLAQGFQAFVFDCRCRRTAHQAHQKG